MRKCLIICLITLLLVSPVFAKEHTIKVDEKRIDGEGGAYIYIIGQQHSKRAYGTLWEEYCDEHDYW